LAVDRFIGFAYSVRDKARQMTGSVAVRLQADRGGRDSARMIEPRSYPRRFNCAATTFGAKCQA
jgi:hypothetical protein